MECLPYDNDRSEKCHFVTQNRTVFTSNAKASMTARSQNNGWPLNVGDRVGQGRNFETPRKPSDVVHVSRSAA